MANDEWSIMALKEHLDSEINNVKENVVTAQAANEKRLSQMNEFRGQLRDQQANFLTRAEYDAKHGALETKIDSLQRLVYIAVGGILVLEFLLRYLIN